MQDLFNSLCAPADLGSVHGGYVLKQVPEVAEGDLVFSQYDADMTAPLHSTVASSQMSTTAQQDEVQA